MTLKEKFKDFTVVAKCKKCGAECEVENENNGACGDPECCGEYRSWIQITCKNCDIINRSEDN